MDHLSLVKFRFSVWHVVVMVMVRLSLQESMQCLYNVPKSDHDLI